MYYMWCINYIRVGYRMLSRDYRLKLTEICCKIRLNRYVTLDEMIWKQNLCDANKHAAGIAERIIGY